jgi:small subunit ribosomal protein S1
VTKVVTFGAFVEIMPGVEGLVHISELAQHHVENPREVVSQGDVVNVKIIEVDADRRRLSLSLKRVDEGDDVQPRADGQPLETPAPPQIDLSDEVFADEAQGADAEAPSDAVLEGDEELAEAEAPSEEPVAEVAEEPIAEVAEEPVAEVAPEGDEPEAPAEDDAEASIEADAVDPTHQGPGDSEGHTPYAPEEAEEPKED